MGFNLAMMCCMMFLCYYKCSCTSDYFWLSVNLQFTLGHPSIFNSNSTFIVIYYVHIYNQCRTYLTYKLAGVMLWAANACHA